MADLTIAPTEKSPGIQLTRGRITFSGRSIVADPRYFFTPVFEWMKTYIKAPAPETVVTFRLEYIDAKSTQVIFDLLKQLLTIQKKRKVIINWFYEYGDMEMLELGELIQARLQADFDFIAL